MSTPEGRVESPAASVILSNSGGRKRKREDPKFYAVRIGKTPGIYYTYADCLEQVKYHKNGQFKAFTSLTQAEAFLKDGLNAASRFSSKPTKFYGVRAGIIPGIYTDWPSAEKQIKGYMKPRHKSFHTRAGAQAFVDGDDNPKTDIDSVNTPASSKRKKLAMSEIDEDVEPGVGPMPPISEDGFDARIILNPEKGVLEYKNEAQRGATKMQPEGSAKGSVLNIYTDGSALGNGQKGSYAGVGVYFGPRDSRNVSEPLRGERQTNQRAELTAIQRAIEIAPKDRDVMIYSDSSYSIKCVTEWCQNWRRNNWKTSAGKAVENRDIIESILQKIQLREKLRSKTLFQWLKGHANDPGNVAADGLAVRAAQTAKADGGSGGSGGTRVDDD